ncbi:hypothetical protein LTR51_000140 [Lithohypha guttulata]|uniref:SIS domain-containing protein n=1 Tax=Lithohypha guttulata TaxID=1690604 RepID=A0AAN7Y616_9EURO|nr:hypothetical protein LTR51_000140 [Lithohypha guttulata]KAK5085334.1 hypothetical protein LTR05_004618 [Lithohypha guttulata]
MPICPPIVGSIEALPATPPESVELCVAEGSAQLDTSSIKKALHVVATERDALTNLENIYARSTTAQSALSKSISSILSSQTQRGKVVFTGVGKSGWIAQKLVATFNSLGVVAQFMHATEALHGDLGLIRPNDVVIMVTYSGRTQELLTLLPHIPSYIPLMVITSHLTSETCPLLTHPRRRGCVNILLPAPVHISEKETFGLSAPTSSTTVALTLGDAIALAIAEQLHKASNLTPAAVFATNHPGGAIGAANTEPRMCDLAVKVDDIEAVAHSNINDVKGLDVLLSAVRSPGGWVKLSSNHVIAPRRCQRLSDPSLLVRHFSDDRGPLIVEQTDWISIAWDCTVEECRQWIVRMRTEGDARGRYFLKPGTILGIVDRQSQKSGLVEIEDVVGEDFCGTL